jgi:hypothetical protein
MDTILEALVGGASSFVHPIILLIVLMPMGIALALWAGLAWA